MTARGSCGRSLTRRSASRGCCRSPTAEKLGIAAVRSALGSARHGQRCEPELVLRSSAAPGRVAHVRHTCAKAVLYGPVAPQGPGAPASADLVLLSAC